MEVVRDFTDGGAGRLDRLPARISLRSDDGRLFAIFDEEGLTLRPVATFDKNGSHGQRNGIKSWQEIDDYCDPDNHHLLYLWVEFIDGSSVGYLLDREDGNFSRVDLLSSPPANEDGIRIQRIVIGVNVALITVVSALGSVAF